MTSDNTWGAVAALVGRLIFAGLFAMAVAFKFADMGATAGYIAAAGFPAARAARMAGGAPRGGAGHRLPHRRLVPRGGARRGGLRDLPRLLLPRAGALGGQPGGVRLLRRSLQLLRRAPLRRRLRTGTLGAAHARASPGHEPRAVRRGAGAGLGGGGRRARRRGGSGRTGCGSSSRRSPGWGGAPWRSATRWRRWRRRRTTLDHPVLGPRLRAATRADARPRRAAGRGDPRRDRRDEVPLVDDALRAGAAGGALLRRGARRLLGRGARSGDAGARRRAERERACARAAAWLSWPPGRGARRTRTKGGLFERTAAASRGPGRRLGRPRLGAAAWGLAWSPCATARSSTSPRARRRRCATSSSSTIRPGGCARAEGVRWARSTSWPRRRWRARRGGRG